ncbi:MAG TPA: NAD(P)/FAD-dependent oxidoreductase [Opitutaceae bacterium]|nr:NAD(P)/FAD-dependent oxidoreductase [Opitutaceae bacterium]
MADLQVVIVGGGAAGFFAAIACAEKNPAARVTLLEATAHPLAKVRVSGGGRCNVTHACFEPRELVQRYPRGGRELLGAFHRWQPRDTVAWFAERGVELKTEADGRMFPVTDNSQTIVDCLLAAAAKAGVKVVTSLGVRSVVGRPPPRSPETPRLAPLFAVTLTDGGTLNCDRLLLATGGNRSSAGLTIAQSLGHAIEPPVPSLFTFHVDDPRVDGISGVSVGNVVATVRGTKLRESGPLLVTHWGLSGPAILKLSAWGARELAAVNYEFTLGMNFAPPHTRESLGRELAAVRAAHPRKQVGSWCPLGLPQRLWEKLLAAARLGPTGLWANASKDALAALAAQIVAAEFTVKGKSMNKEEFVTCGGVRLSEVDFKTMESRICPGLHFAGEVLDIDGITGGFNFQSAWTTGWLAGGAMAGVAEAGGRKPED